MSNGINKRRNGVNTNVTATQMTQITTHVETEQAIYQHLSTINKVNTVCQALYHLWQNKMNKLNKKYQRLMPLFTPNFFTNINLSNIWLKLG